MKLRTHKRWSLWSAAVLGLLLATVPLAGQVPHPKDVFGFTPGDDYKLAVYSQMLEYYQQLDAASERVQLRQIGKSVLGRPLLLLFISSEANLKQLTEWREISEKLARARIDQAEARDLAKRGKAIVWIDGGLHATEVAHGQMTSLLAYKVATEETPEMQKIRENVILLLMPVMNPDGLDIVAAWYKKNLGTPFETTRPPILYHHYVGHDNNRDWFMNNMPESKAVSKVIYTEWYPQIVYNHHQSSPGWTRIFLPPFADPVNPNIHPGVTTGVNLVGSAMANRFAMRKMPGVVSDMVFSMWWNGGMRTVPYFHNMIGILTETAHATPSPRYYDPDSMPKMIGSRRSGGAPTNGTDIFYPYPWKGGESRFADPVNYMITASMAVLNIAAELREQFLWNIYAMGRDAIEKGEKEPPFAFIIHPEQWNAGEEINLINILRLGGVEVHKARTAFQAGGRTYPEGSYVIYAAQAFRPYVVDLLEKQQYPDRRTAGGQPDPPYDIAGWTLPLQMGVRVARIDSSFDAPTDMLTEDARPSPGRVDASASFGYVLSHRPNASALVTNQLLEAGEQVYWAGSEISTGGKKFEAGSIIIRNRGEKTRQRLEHFARELGLDFDGLEQALSTSLHRLRLPRVGLYKSWVSNMDEGWTRWLLTEYAFPHDTLHDADVRGNDLGRYHAIILPDQSAERILNGHLPGTMPAPYVGGLGIEGAMALKKYVEDGGTLIALDGACDFAIEQFGLPVRNAVARVPSSRFFIPGSLIRLSVHTGHPLAYGMPQEAVANFVRSRAFEVVRLERMGEGGKEKIPEAPAPPVEIVARYAKKDLLMSGWALGEKRYLSDKPAMVSVPLGKGRVVLIGFRVQFRGQPRGTYKLLFNAIHAATLEQMPKYSPPADHSEPTESDAGRDEPGELHP